jgi:hypothetical protein
MNTKSLFTRGKVERGGRRNVSSHVGRTRFDDGGIGKTEVRAGMKSVGDGIRSSSSSSRKSGGWSGNMIRNRS